MNARFARGLPGSWSCADLAELHSAYVDGALRDSDRERLLRHLVDCPPCRSDVDDLRRVRRLLAQPGREPEAPNELSSRLLSIAADRPDDPVGGPPRRGATVWATAAVVALGLSLVAVGGVGYATAPAATSALIADPTTEAVSEYSSVFTQLPFASRAASVVSAVSATDRTGTPVPRDLGAAPRTELDAAQVRAVLAQAARAGAGVSYRGRLDYLAVDGNRQVSARVDAVNSAGQGLRLAAFDSTGRSVGSWFHPVVSDTRMADEMMVSVLARRYQLTAWSGTRVAGRAAIVLEARRRNSVTALTGSDDALAARWWLDTTTGLVLWQETYDAAGAVATTTGFTSLQLGARSFLGHLPPTVVPMTTASLTLSRARGLSGGGWTCLDQLAGLSLVRLRSDAAADPGMLHLVYSDGVSTVSVFEQRGRLDGEPADTRYDAATRSYVGDGTPAAATWQSGDTVFTVVTNASDSTLSAAVAALPHDPLRRPSTMDRVRAGWARILGAA